MKPDAEQDLVKAAEELSEVLAVAESRSFRRGRKGSAELRAELADLDLEAKTLLARDLVTDAEMRALTRKFRRAAGFVLDAIKFASGPTM